MMLYMFTAMYLKQNTTGLKSSGQELKRQEWKRCDIKLAF